MSVNSISGINTTQTTSSTNTKKETKSKSDSASKCTYDEKAAEYEKSVKTSTVNNKATSTTDRKAIVEALKADAEARYNQLMEIVRNSINGQGTSFANSKGMKSLFENLTVDADTIARAKKDIAEDGYWCVKQTSDRILDFAKALSGDDPDKADELLDAFKKGFKQATKSWGDKLPSICQDTYDAVVDKFEKWKNETKTATE